jgi:hypothetical protein
MILVFLPILSNSPSLTMVESLGTMQDRAPDADDTDPNTGMQLAFCYFYFWGFGVYSITVGGDLTLGAPSWISAKFVKLAFWAASTISGLVSWAFELVSYPKLLIIPSTWYFYDLSGLTAYPVDKLQSLGISDSLTYSLMNGYVLSHCLKSSKFKTGSPSVWDFGPSLVFNSLNNYSVKFISWALISR